MAEKTKNYPLLQEGQYTVSRVDELNYFDLTGARAGTLGTSAKMYHVELNIEKNGIRAQIYTMYGPTGHVQRKEWRHFPSIDAASKEYDKLLNSKRKKGYKDIDVAQRALGSSEALAITKAVDLKNTEHLRTVNKSDLHPQTARFINEIMGATNQFVITTLKCPLGQLTNKQIDEGRARLETAKQILKRNGSRNELVEITNEFYSMIPYNNLGQGSRGKMEHLLLDDIQKITQKEDDLDTLLDAKSVGAVLASNDVDEKYKSLNAQMKFVDSNSDLFKWISALVLGTRASNHRHLGKISVLNVWELSRDSEYPKFRKRAEEIAKECGKQTIPDMLKPYMKRIDIQENDKELYLKANVLPLFHGTRTQNLTGILKNGLLIRPAGVVLCGAMYGNACYHSDSSSKSIGYSSIHSSYWAGGKDNHAFLFLNDCILGNQKIASGSYQYTKGNILPHHSVWAIGGKSGVLNGEMMLYDTNQHTIRYVIEFTC